MGYVIFWNSPNEQALKDIQKSRVIRNTTGTCEVLSQSLRTAARHGTAASLCSAGLVSKKPHPTETAHSDSRRGKRRPDSAVCKRLDPDRGVWHCLADPSASLLRRYPAEIRQGNPKLRKPIDLRQRHIFIWS